MIDIANQLNAIDRKVEQLPAADGAGERVCVRMRRSYDAQFAPDQTGSQEQQPGG